jgi:uncharacterized membrane protein YphA (DoxX/SURF4 family)
MAQGRASTAALLLSGWKTAASTVAAILLAIVFLVAGVWKTTDPFSAAVRLSQAQVPDNLSLPLALLLGIAETYAGVLLLVPRFRRWGAWLTALELLAFLIYISAYYNVLRGEECNCFPWLKRAVGPSFFIGDGIMLVLAGVAGWWARPSQSTRSAILVLGAVVVFALACFGVTAARQPAVITAPEWITADGKPFPLHQGRVFLYFFDPECTYCDVVARQMARYDWRETTVIAVALAQPGFAQQFMQATGLRGLVSQDVERLRGTFSFIDQPYAVALVNGQQKAAFSRSRLMSKELESELRALRLIR